MISSIVSSIRDGLLRVVSILGMVSLFVLLLWITTKLLAS